jgi:hypothetical protein
LHRNKTAANSWPKATQSIDQPMMIRWNSQGSVASDIGQRDWVRRDIWPTPGELGQFRDISRVRFDRVDTAIYANYTGQQPSVYAAVSPYVGDRLGRPYEPAYYIAYGVMLQSFLEQSKLDTQPGIDRVNNSF